LFGSIGGKTKFLLFWAFSRLSTTGYLTLFFPWADKTLSLLAGVLN
jgi:hypothetical protein